MGVKKKFGANMAHTFLKIIFWPKNILNHTDCKPRTFCTLFFRRVREVPGPITSCYPKEVKIWLKLALGVCNIHMAYATCKL